MMCMPGSVPVLVCLFVVGAVRKRARGCPRSLGELASLLVNVRWGVLAVFVALVLAVGWVVEQAYEDAGFGVCRRDCRRRSA